MVHNGEGDSHKGDAEAGGPVKSGIVAASISLAIRIWKLRLVNLDWLPITGMAGCLLSILVWHDYSRDHLPICTIKAL